ncbi:hypothetical protein [Intrasporangium oryzae]|uniref:hypothetical protein n=1 Tax=Intrasporangium oryzae TaxID=412687 RepID=UPI0012FA83DE|nr:hypothetical protein [Intrasporangium oryzae]
MAITASDFITESSTSNPWGMPVVGDSLDEERLRALMVRPDPKHSDVEVSLALMDLVRDDLHKSGTEGGQLLADAEMRTAIRALESVTARAGYEFKLPFRDHAGWRAWWNRNGAHGSWQARRNLLSDLFDDTYAKLMAAQDRALASTLALPVSPHERLGWHEVDTEIGELRRHFRTASTPQDYRAIGNDCVHLTEALSRQVYDHATHTPAGEEEPPFPKTKIRLERYIEHRLPGPENAQMRAMARAVINVAQGVKHGGSPSRTEAGIVADAVILLANMLRRLEEEIEA